MDEQIVLVDENDNQVGIAGKAEVHSTGVLHRAVSVFILNSVGELLLQKRAQTKYHCAGLWSNSCCGHPLPDETSLNAAMRRLHDEMGLKTNLNYLGAFIYKANLNNGLIEHELDHVFYGVSDNPPMINPLEADDWKYMKGDKLVDELKKNAERYTPWLKICIDRKILGKLI